MSNSICAIEAASRTLTTWASASAAFLAACWFSAAFATASSALATRSLAFSMAAIAWSNCTPTGRAHTLSAWAAESFSSVALITSSSWASLAHFKRASSFVMRVLTSCAAELLMLLLLLPATVEEGDVNVVPCLVPAAASSPRFEGDTLERLSVGQQQTQTYRSFLFSIAPKQSGPCSLSRCIRLGVWLMTSALCAMYSHASVLSTSPRSGVGLSK